MEKRKNYTYGRRRRRRILLSHNITIQSTHSTVAGLLEKTNVHHAGHLNKTHTNKKEITYEHKTTKKERKDSEITQYDCNTGVSNTMSSYQDTISE